MLSKRLRKRIGKNCLIWTLITAVFTAAYATGLYMLYKENIYDDIHNLKGSAMAYTSFFRVYQRYNNLNMLDIAIGDLADCNYFYYGKIEDDGSLTDIYKTDYDLYELNAANGLFGRKYSDADIIDYYLTDDVDKTGKVEHISLTTKYEKTTTECCERHYLACPEDVFNKIKSAQNNGKHLVREWVFWDLLYWYPFDTVFSDNETVNILNRVYRKAVWFITYYLTHNIEDFNSDISEYKPYIINDYDGAYIRRADVDFEAGKILSGELMINGDRYNFPDDNLTDSDTILTVSLHKRPDSILENNKELLRDNFDKSYLEGLKYEEGSVPGFGDYGSQVGLEGITYDVKHEDSQLVISGICKYDDGYFRYVYILPYAGFFESFAPCILEVMLKVWIPGLIVAALLGMVVSRKRY